MVNSMQTLKYLKIVTYPNFYNWSVQYLLESDHSYNEKYNFVKIGSFLKRNKTPIDIIDGIEYKRVTIKINNNGVFLRDIEKGENIGTKKQFTIKKGQFLLSKIDARNGAFGVVPEMVNNAIITGNFWTYDVDYSLINPYFLALITTTPEFIKFCENASNGTTNRHYLQEGLFLNQNIPLPSLTEQNRIIEVYNSKLNLAEQQLIEAKELEESIEKYLFEELGIVEDNKKVGKEKKIFQLIKFSETQRWDALFLLDKLPSIVSSHELVKFSDIIKYFNKGENGKTIRIDSPKFPNDDFRYIGMEHIEKVTGILLDMPEVKGKEIKSQTLRIPKNFFIYGKLRPYLNKYWINDTDFDNIICSSEFFVFDTIETLDKLFFKYVLSSKIIQNQISDKTSGARMPRINEDIFFNLQFPLPPIEKQKEISDKINNVKSKIKQLNSLSIKNKEEAISVFEKEIFI